MVVGTKRDAEAFDAEVRRRKRTGDLGQPDAGRERLSNFAEDHSRVPSNFVFIDRLNGTFRLADGSRDAGGRRGGGALYEEWAAADAV